MPWTIDDVDSKKKGLSDKQKKQWVRIANSVLKAEMKKGKSEEEAAVSAIKQANGVVNANTSNFALYVNKQQSDYEVKLLIHQKKAHIIIPVVMMVEGVHKGSQGALYHSIDELGKFPASWNGIPIVINHPEVDGIYTSANSPEIIEERTVGRVYNTNVDNNKLIAEAWLDEDKLNDVSPDILSAINDNKIVEVSIGVFNDVEETEGDWNGEHYDKIAHNHRPDHLALLTDCAGACSVKDGCGLGANQKDKDIQDKEIESGKVKSIDSVEQVNSNNNKEDKKMAENKCPKCLEKINALIANQQSPFVETDREWLLTQEESILDKLAPQVVEKVVEKTVEVNKLTPSQEADLAFVARQRAEKRNSIIQGIQANTSKELWSDETLNAMSEDMLERVYKSVKKEEVVDYSFQANAYAKVSGEEPLAPTGITFETK
jgi:hypothetical protein